MTWLSRRESADGPEGASSFLGISVAAIGIAWNSCESRKCVEKSTVLNFQQSYGFVNSQVSAAFLELDIAVDRVHSDERSASPNLLPHPDIAPRRTTAGVPLGRLGDRDRPVADDSRFAPEVVGVGGGQVQSRIQIARRCNRYPAISRCRVDRALAAEIDCDIPGARLRLDGSSSATDVDVAASSLGVDRAAGGSDADAAASRRNARSAGRGG